MDWQMISVIVIIILGAIGGGLFIKLKNLMKQTKEFIDYLVDALEDDKISAEEIADILKEGKDVAIAAMDIAKLFTKAK